MGLKISIDKKQTAACESPTSSVIADYTAADMMIVSKTNDE